MPEQQQQPTVESTKTPTESTPTQTNTQAPPTQPKSYKVKVEGQELEVDENTLVRDYQLSKASQKRFQEAAAKTKQAEELLSALKSNPWEVMKQLGLDPRTASEEYLANLLEQEMLSPEAKKIKDLEDENKSFKQKQKEQEEAQNRQKMDLLTQQAEQHIESELIKALDSSKLPRKPALIRKVVENMIHAEQNGYELSVQDAVKIAESEYFESIKEIFSGYDDVEKVIELLGEEKLKKIRERDLRQLKNPAPTKKDVQPSKKEETKKRFESPEEYKQFMRDKLGVK